VNLRTYEILAKWIAKQHNVSIRFEPNVTPQASCERNEIVLPSNIHSSNTYGALATLIHEAAHLNYTRKVKAKEIAKDDMRRFMILNAMEDARIDNKNFDVLDNINEFYEIMYEEDMAERKRNPPPKKPPLWARSLGEGILSLENFTQFSDCPEAQKYNRDNKIEDIMDEGVTYLENNNTNKISETVDKLMKTYQLDKLPPQPIPKGFMSKMGFDDGEKKGKGSPQASDEEIKAALEAIGLTGEIRDLIASKDKIFKPSKGCGSGDGTGSSVLGQIALQELTKQKFKELLSIKQRKKIYDGTKLDTDSLPAFLTGDIEGLFTEEKIIKAKKSKIIIIMDGSGSMDSHLMDGQACNSVVAGCVKELTTVLDEVINLEGINVDYEIAGFTGSFHPLTKENWLKEYLRMGGGTDMVGAFKQAQKTILNDQEIEGKKLIVFFTDGDVGIGQVTEMKKDILKYNADVRCMIIGVGSEITGEFVKEICGDFNILAKEASDSILLEVLMTMLD
jgi:hypothetical protein